MLWKRYRGLLLAGFFAGAVNGLFGAGGGMILVPLLSLAAHCSEEDIFTSSIAIILPICLISLTATAWMGHIPWAAALPYLPGSAVGGFLAGKYGQKIPALWLHRGLGLMILWGGIRYLC